MALSQFTFDFEDEPSSNKDNKKVELPLAEKSKRGRKKLKDYTPLEGTVNVPEDELLFQKQYYPIGDVATMFGENISLVRYWANEFTILKPKTNKKGDRFFRPEDVKNLKLIHHLLRERKYTLEGAKEFLKNNKFAGEKQDMIASLEKIKLFLLELKNNL
ncbi:MAG: MerR family transcriptional regulator [Ginsengibacter sp.]